MASYTPADYKKYMYSLASRDVRRITAKVLRQGLDSSAEHEIVCLLELLEGRLMLAAFYNGAEYAGEEGTPLVEGGMRTYSDGRPVTTTVDWETGFCRLVHPADPLQPEEHLDVDNLAEEVWPSSEPEPPCWKPEDDTDGEGRRGVIGSLRQRCRLVAMQRKWKLCL